VAEEEQVDRGMVPEARGRDLGLAAVEWAEVVAPAALEVGEARELAPEPEDPEAVERV
jgi:hypothetical protein